MTKMLLVGSCELIIALNCCVKEQGRSGKIAQYSSLNGNFRLLGAQTSP